MTVPEYALDPENAGIRYLFSGFLHPLVLCVSAVKILGKGEFCKQAKRGRNMPITCLEMVSFAFHSQAKRDRNASETQPIPERPPCEKHAGTLVQTRRGEREKRSGVSIAVAFRQRTKGRKQSWAIAQTQASIGLQPVFSNFCVPLTRGIAARRPAAPIFKIRI